MADNELPRGGEDGERGGIPRGVKLRHKLRGHTDRISQIAWSPDGRMLASGSDDTTIRLWDTETGESLGILKGHAGAIRGVVWSPDGRILRYRFGRPNHQVLDRGDGRTTGFIVREHRRDYRDVMVSEWKNSCIRTR